MRIRVLGGADPLVRCRPPGRLFFSETEGDTWPQLRENVREATTALFFGARNAALPNSDPQREVLTEPCEASACVEPLRLLHWI